MPAQLPQPPSRRRRPAAVGLSLLTSLLASLLAALLAAPAALAGGGGEPAERAAPVVAELKTRLGAELKAALAEGPEHAIEVCRVRAPETAREAGASGIAVGRTSHRLRNPANAPEPWMEPLIEHYVGRPPEPGSHRTVDLGERGTGYVEPIYLQPLCVTCHGEAVDPGLLAAIRERYPEDRATGFRPGELRGLFWAVVPPDAPAP